MYKPSFQQDVQLYPVKKLSTYFWWVKCFQKLSLPTDAQNNSRNKFKKKKLSKKGSELLYWKATV